MKTPKRKKKQYRVKRLEKMPLMTGLLFLEIGNGGYFEDPKNPKMGELIRYVADYLGEPLEEISDLERPYVIALAGAIERQLKHYEPKDPPKELNFMGTKYVLVEEYHKQTAGWWNHVEQIDPSVDPAKFVALNYIEEGMSYAEKDAKTKAILNHTSEREEVLKEILSARDFMDLVGFFLYKFEMLKRITWASRLNQEEMMKRVKMRLRPFLGSEA